MRITFPFFHTLLPYGTPCLHSHGLVTLIPPLKVKFWKLTCNSYLMPGFCPRVHVFVSSNDTFASMQIVKFFYRKHKLQRQEVDTNMQTVSVVEDTATHCHSILNLGYTWCSIQPGCCGTIKPSNGFIYLLTCVDHFTHWLEAIPIADIMTDTVVNAFVAGWIAWFGVWIPFVITTDWRGQFEPHLWQQLARLLGTKRIRTTDTTQKQMVSWNVPIAN